MLFCDYRDTAYQRPVPTSMHRLIPTVIRLFQSHFFPQTPLCGMSHGQDMYRIATDGEEDAVFAMPLAIEQHPHFLTIGSGIRIDRASRGACLERFDLGPDTA